MPAAAETLVTTELAPATDRLIADLDTQATTSSDSTFNTANTRSQTDIDRLQTAQDKVNNAL